LLKPSLNAWRTSTSRGVSNGPNSSVDAPKVRFLGPGVRTVKPAATARNAASICCVVASMGD
jgi:hypothetical protein